jgi:hypothetical protein
MGANPLSSCRSALVLVPVALCASRSKSLSIGTCARLSSMLGKTMKYSVFLLVLTYSFLLSAEDVISKDQVLNIINGDKPEVTEFPIERAVSQLIQNDQSTKNEGLSLSLTVTIIKKATDSTFVAKHEIKKSGKSIIAYYVFEVKNSTMNMVKRYD